MTPIKHPTQNNLYFFTKKLKNGSVIQKTFFDCSFCPWVKRELSNNLAMRLATVDFDILPTFIKNFFPSNSEVRSSLEIASTILRSDVLKFE